jgi:acetylornithine deacetylase
VPEACIASYIESYFAHFGIETTRQVIYPDRPNIIARIPGRNPSRRIVLEAHMDTVATAGMTIEPWSAEIRQGQLYGRGSCDTKGGLAAMMHAMAQFVVEARTPPCEVLMVAAIDEEFSYRGALAFCQDPPLGLANADGFLAADAAIIAEPTCLQPVIASKGLVRWKIETIGQAAHSAKPHLGINAIEHMAKVIALLEEDNRIHDSKPPHPLLGRATCNIGLIRGGVQVNFVPDRCEIEIDRRMLPGETCDKVLEHYRSLLAQLQIENKGLEVVMHPPMLTDGPLETDPSAPPVLALQKVLRDAGLNDTLVGVPFCSDASKFGALGIPSIIFGPGNIDQAHAAVEFVDCLQVEQAAAIYYQFIATFQ